MQFYSSYKCAETSERERERERERECKLLYFDNITMALCHRFAMLLQCWVTGLYSQLLYITVVYCENVTEALCHCFAMLPHC